MRLNVLLSLTDTLRIKFKGMVNDHTKFYKGSQGAFTGTKATYVPREGTIDEPSKRGLRKVVTTVDEKIDYFIKESALFIDSLLSQERTNAEGGAIAELVVSEVSWGTFTSLELLRLKSLLESSDLGNLETMIRQIPVRADELVWDKSVDPEYTDRDIWETPKISGIAKGSAKENYILTDPNVQSGNAKSYTPQLGVRTNIIELGDFTAQNFSGAWSHKKRAGALKRRNDLIVAVVQALKECNECESVKSGLTAEKIFGFIFEK